MLYIEVKDLMRFANQLKVELSEKVKTNNCQVNQTRALLIQSIKDLGKKKEQFLAAFEEAFNNRQWLKLSKQTK